MKRLLAIIFVCAFMLLSCGGRGESSSADGSVKIESISFCADGDVELRSGSEPDSAKGYVIIKEADDRSVGEDDILFVSEDANVASVRVLNISKTLIQYEITAGSPGETYIFAQSSDGGAVSGKIRVAVDGTASETESTDAETESAQTEMESAQSDSNPEPETEPETEPESESEAASSGSSALSGEENIVTEAETVEVVPHEESTGVSESAAQPESGEAYVINKNTKKIHKPTCSSVKQIKPENYGTTDDPESLLAQGYEWCKRCAG